MSLKKMLAVVAAASLAAVAAPAFAAKISSSRAFIHSADIVEHLLGPPTITPTRLSVTPW